MKTSEIKKLVEAFYNGETTIEEEKLLLSYFQGEDIAEELLKERDLFLDLYKSEPIDVPLQDRTLDHDMTRENKARGFGCGPL